MQDGDVLLKVLQASNGIKKTLIKRGNIELVIIDVTPPYSDSFHPDSQIEISSLTSSFPRYEVWLNGDFFTAYGSK